MVQFITEHYDEVLQIFGAVVGLVTLITKLTSTDKDNTIWAKVLKVLSALSLVNPDGSVIGKKAEQRNMAQIYIAGVFVAIIAVLLAVARNNGKKAEQLRAMRETAEREAKERERESKIKNDVANMANDDVRARLRRVSQGHNRNDL